MVMAFITVIHQGEMAQAKVCQVVLRCPLLKLQCGWAHRHCLVSEHDSGALGQQLLDSPQPANCRRMQFVSKELFLFTFWENVFIKVGRNYVPVQIITILLRSNQVNQLIINSESSSGGWQGSFLAGSPAQLLTSEGNNSRRCDALHETSVNTNPGLHKILKHQT